MSVIACEAYGAERAPAVPQSPHGPCRPAAAPPDEIMYQAEEFSSIPDAAAAIALFRKIASETTDLAGRVVDRPLVLYGAGNLGRMACEYLDQVGIPIELVIDVNAERIVQHPWWSNRRVCRPECVPEHLKQSALLAVCVVTSRYVPLARQLAECGWTDVVPFYDLADRYRDRHPLGNGWFAATFDAGDCVRIERCLEAWADDVSRAHHLQFIAWRRLRCEWTFAGAPVETGNRFFTPEILSVLHDNESFLDVGAHLGTVSTAFADHVQGRFAHIWMLEPDRMSLKAMMATLDALPATQRMRVSVLPVAVGSKPATMPFAEGLGYASQFSAMGQTSLECTTIDALNLAPTFIKLHLEGMELPALKGAAQTIARHRPILAATSYHNHDGLWRLPSWLHETLRDYAVTMRMHAWCGTGATVYAVPRERIR